MKKVISYFICHNNLYHEISEKDGTFHFEIHDNGNIVHTEHDEHRTNIIKKFMDKFKEHHISTM